MKAVDGRQLRAARAILGWTSEEAAKAARIHRNSVTYTENKRTLPWHSYAGDRLGTAYEAAGILFDRNEAGPSVSFRAPRARASKRHLLGIVD